MLDRFHIAVTSSRPLTRTTIELVSGTLGLTVYDARLRLLSAFPRSIAFRRDSAQAMDLAQRLYCPELSRIVYRESDVPPQQLFAAFRMGRTLDGFIFEDRQGERTTVPRNDISRVVIGMKTTTSTESSIEYSDCNYQYGAEGARSPMMFNQVRRRRRRHAMFFTFFSHVPNARPIRIVTDVFDFRCLGRQRGLSDHANARRLFDMIDAAIVDIPADRRLLDTGVSPTSVPHNPRLAVDVEHAASFLVYWDCLARKHPDGLFDATGQSVETRQ